VTAGRWLASYSPRSGVEILLSAERLIAIRGSRSRFTWVCFPVEQSGKPVGAPTGAHARSVTHMPFLLLVLIAVVVAVCTALIAMRVPDVTGLTSVPTATTAHAVGHAVARRPGLRAIVSARLDPVSLTGLALTIALAIVIAGGLLLGVLAYLIRANAGLGRIDDSVARWGDEHATALSTRGLTAITHLGATELVIALGVVLLVVETKRTRNWWIGPFLVLVIGGAHLLTVTIKDLVDRVRPELDPIAATLGPSFPSGHSSTAAAFYAAASLLLGRRRVRRSRALLTGAAVGIAVAVAGSRVLLDVHWLTDVVAGLALGWAWFALCGIAFGGRVLRFGAAAETVERVATRHTLPEERSDHAAGTRPRAP
jgi:membrane-associated phospholipid phosphatase